MELKPPTTTKNSFTILCANCVRFQSILVTSVMGNKNSYRNDIYFSRNKSQYPAAYLNI